MSSHQYRLQRVGSRAFALAALALLVCAVLWPPVIAEVLRSRLAVALLAVWSGGFAGLLHPEVSARVALGLREFGKATREVTREIRGDDDDDDPSAT